MVDDDLIFAKCPETLRAYEERADRERAAAKAATGHELASARRLLAIQYQADADELRRQIATKA